MDVEELIRQWLEKAREYSKMAQEAMEALGRVQTPEVSLQIPEVSERIQEAESALKGKGRVVVRYSGTEALARVMIEAESREEMERHAERIAQAIRSTLGV